MNHFENPLRLVKELKGAGWAIYCILRFTGHPLGEAFLAINSGYSRNSVREALGYMNEKGMVRRNERYGGWALTGDAEQLPLGNWEITDGENPITDAGSSKFDPPVQTPENREAQILSIEGQIEPRINVPEENNPKKEAGSSNFEHRGSNFELPAPLASSSLTNTRLTREDLLARTDLAKIIDDAGIRNPARAEIMAMPDISSDWIKGHLESAKTVGQAIYRIKRRWDLPKDYHPGPGPVMLPADSCERNEIPEGDAETEQLWHQALDVLQLRLDQTIVRGWLPGARLERSGTNDYLVVCMNVFAMDKLEQAAGKILGETLTAITGRACQLKFIERET